MKEKPKPSGEASSQPSEPKLSPTEQQAVDTAERIAQGQDAGPSSGGPDNGGGGTVAPPSPTPTVTNAGRLAARTVDQVLFRLFGPAGPLPPGEHDDAEQCWSELLTEIGIAIPSLGPGGKLMILYGTHIGALYAIQWLTEPPKPLSPDSPAAEKQPSSAP
jgi:hypothetical protein